MGRKTVVLIFQATHCRNPTLENMDIATEKIKQKFSKKMRHIKFSRTLRHKQIPQIRPKDQSSY